MKKNLLNELNQMKYLFGYKAGKVISEQETPSGANLSVSGETKEQIEMSGREVETPVRPDVDTPTVPKTPKTPYRPKPGPKKNPKAKSDELPDWLTFDELGLNFED